MSVIQEVLSAIRVVKAFGQEDREHDRFVDRSIQGMRGKIRIAVLTGLLSLVIGLTVAVGTAAVLYVGVVHVQNGRLTLGELLMVMAYLAQLYGPMETLSKKIADMQGSLVCAERAFSLLDQMPEVSERTDAKPLERAIGHIAFQNIVFAYPDRPAVLEGATFDIPAGSRVGIVGRTGAGKSTLMSLLMRFYDPVEGSIQLDGTDLRDYRLSDLRNQFAIVLQEPVLFSVSVGENIAYAKPGATRDEIEAAARAANAHEFIMAMPQGYETTVGERGMKLSGGERQRISLARAFLKNAPILILDEPTSSVDTATEGLIIEAIERLLKGRTTFMIAHRLSTIESAELLLLVADGTVTLETKREAVHSERVA
jgi:ATP-binding cassette subfamily B protein